MGYLKVYDNGNCNAFPYASMTIDERGVCKFYPNGNCNGIHIWSMQKTSRYTEVYRQPGLNGIPDNYFQYISPGRRGGPHGGVAFYPNGNGNGIPIYFFSFLGDNAVEFYPNGNGNGIPELYFEQCNRTVYYYPNGNGNGIPIYTIDDVNDIRDVIELVFYLFIPQGAQFCPGGRLSDRGGDRWGEPSSNYSTNSYVDEANNRSSSDEGERRSPDRSSRSEGHPRSHGHDRTDNDYSAPSAHDSLFAHYTREAIRSGRLSIKGLNDSQPHFAQLLRQAQLAHKVSIEGLDESRLQTGSRPQPASSAVSRQQPSSPGRNSILSGIWIVIKAIVCIFVFIWVLLAAISFVYEVFIK